MNSSIKIKGSVKTWMLIIFVIVLKLLNTEVAEGSLRSARVIPVTTKEIEFELEVTDTLLVDPVYLDFGNIVKNTKETVHANSYFLLNATYGGDMYVTSNYLGGLDEGEFKKFKVYREGESTGDYIEVHLRKLENSILSPGEKRIPVVGEIREVGDVVLGKYAQTIQMDVTVQPVNP